MASRTRNRALGIAALIVAVAAAVAVLLLSQSEDTQRVTPLREDAVRHEPDGGLVGPDRPTRFQPPVPVPGANRDERKDERRSGRGRDTSSGRRADTGGARLRTLEKTRRARSNGPRRGPAAQPLPPRPIAPQPVPAPTPQSPPAAAADPSPTEPPAIQPGSQPKPSPADPRPVEATTAKIEIEDGEIEDDVERVRSADGHVRLLVRSDELVLVELEDSARTWLVPAHGESVIEFDTSSPKGAKLDLRHRKGLLVLRVRA